MVELCIISVQLTTAGSQAPAKAYSQAFPHPVRASALRRALVTPIPTSQQLRHRFFSLYIRLKNNHTSNKDNFLYNYRP
jgi:hypothetical protein